MIKKTITYTNFNDEVKTKDFYFHMSETELMKMSVSEEGGFQNFVKKIIAENNYEKLLEMFEELLAKAYGVKSEDGESFIKTPELTAAFINSIPYNSLVMEVCNNADVASAFVNGLMPESVAKLVVEDATTRRTEQFKVVEGMTLQQRLEKEAAMSASVPQQGASDWKPGMTGVTVPGKTAVYDPGTNTYTETGV